MVDDKLIDKLFKKLIDKLIDKLVDMESNPAVWSREMTFGVPQKPRRMRCSLSSFRGEQEAVLRYSKAWSLRLGTEW